MQTQNYWHSLEEKTDLLEKYLQTIGVNEVSCSDALRTPFIYRMRGCLKLNRTKIADNKS